MYQNDMIERFKYHIATIIIFLSALFAYLHLPDYTQNDNGIWGYYFTKTNEKEPTFRLLGTDEWVYYRQAMVILDKGFAGFDFLSKEYINVKDIQEAPSPLRIGAIIISAAVVSANNSPFSIVLFCLLNFVALLWGTFVFVKRFWSSELALLVVVLLGISPIEHAMARRVLMDFPAFTAMALSCYAFWFTAVFGKLKHQIAFVLLISWAVLIKETSGILLPFFGVYLLYMYWRKTTPLSFIHICLLMAAPVVLCGLAYLTFLGYNNWIEVLKTDIHAVTNSWYNAKWTQGPWYSTLINYMLVSPLITLLALGYTGYLLLTFPQTNKHTRLVLLLALFVLTYHCFLPKNIRYALLLDFPLRFFAAGFILSLSSFFHDKKLLKTALPIAIIILLVVIDIQSFYTYFIEYDVYDPVAYNLLVVSKIIPLSP